MTDTLVRIIATPEAKAALATLTAAFGPLMFHTSGGRVGGRTNPICLPAQELRLGARDHLLGEVEGVAIYQMEDRDGGVAVTANQYTLDIAAGPSLGFSLPAGPGLRFTLTPDGSVCPAE